MSGSHVAEPHVVSRLSMQQPTLRTSVAPAHPLHQPNAVLLRLNAPVPPVPGTAAHSLNAPLGDASLVSTQSPGLWLLLFCGIASVVAALRRAMVGIQQSSVFLQPHAGYQAMLGIAGTSIGPNDDEDTAKSVSAQVSTSLCGRVCTMCV